MSNNSKLPRVGSHTSVTSSGSSVDASSHNHILNSIRPALPSLRTWLQESMAANQRHERIAAGITMSAGIAAMTREVVGMQQPSDIRHILDNLPAARADDLCIRRRFRSWSMPRQEEVRRKLGTWPLTKTEALLARQYPVQGR